MNAEQLLLSPKFRMAFLAFVVIVVGAAIVVLNVMKEGHPF